MFMYIECLHFEINEFELKKRLSDSETEIKVERDSNKTNNNHDTNWFDRVRNKQMKREKKTF